MCALKHVDNPLLRLHGRLEQAKRGFAIGDLVPPFDKFLNIDANILPRQVNVVVANSFDVAPPSPQNRLVKAAPRASAELSIKSHVW